MSKTKRDFNLLRFVYGELYLSSAEKAQGNIILDSWKLYRGWGNILKWLKDNHYINTLSIERINALKVRITYSLNPQLSLYPNYIKYLQRLTDDRSA